MLTEKDIKEQYGNNITFLFKPHLEENGETVFTQSDNGKPMGALIEKDGKVQCYECGKWFKHLGIHLKWHKISSEDYKKKYGFSKLAGLCNREISRKRSALSSRICLENKERSIETLILARAKRTSNKLKKINNPYYSIQAKNGRNTCPAQYEERFKLLIAKLGKNLGAIEAEKIDCGAVHWAKRTFGSWNNAKEKFGLKPNDICKRKEESELIYGLREYVKKFGQLPWGAKKYNEHKRLNGFEFSIDSYVRHFGSRVKAWGHCGIRRIRFTKKWEIID